MGLNTTPRTWTTNELVTAAMLNTEVRDALTGVQSAWTTYTPAWTASTTNPTLGNGTLTGAYRQIGKTVWYRIALTYGTTTAAGSGNYQFSLPVATTFTQGDPMGAVYILNSTVKVGQANCNTSTTVYVIRTSTETIISNAGAGAAWASGNVVRITGCYETT